MKLNSWIGFSAMIVGCCSVVVAGDVCSLNIVVRDRSDKAPLPGVEVTLHDDDGQKTDLRLLTGKDGSALFGALDTERSYTVSTMFPSAVPAHASFRCSSPPNALELSVDFPLSISIVALIARPDDFHGKYVVVDGVLSLRYENNALYLSSEDRQKTFTKNALWVQPTAEMSSRRGSLDGKAVRVVGRFNAQSHGHLGLFSGSIEEVQECMRLDR